MPSKSIGAVKTKIPLLAVTFIFTNMIKDEHETKLQNITFYYWQIQHIDVLPAKKISTFRDSSPYLMWAWNSCFTGLIRDQLCPVAIILQVLKAGNVSYQLYLLDSESCIRWWHTEPILDFWGPYAKLCRPGGIRTNEWNSFVRVSLYAHGKHSRNSISSTARYAFN